MVNNSLSKTYKFLATLLQYQPPQFPQSFVLDGGQQEKPNDASEELLQSFQDFKALVRYGQRLSVFMNKVIAAGQKGHLLETLPDLKVEYQALLKQQADITPVLQAYDHQVGNSERPISASLEENRRIIESIYHLPLNKDIVIREIDIAAKPPVKALAVFTDGLVDNKGLNLTVLQPLMRPGSAREKLYEGDLVGRITREYLPNNQVQRADTFKKVQEGINNGDTAIIFDGITEAILVNTRGWEHRGVEKPSTEASVRGSLTGFTENLRTNTALIRTILRNSDLVTEMLKVGTRSRTNVALLYIKSLANAELVAEVRRRIQGVSTDNIDSSGTLIQFIEDKSGFLFPQTLSTERPDRVGVHLSEGRLAVVVEGNPYVQILPISFFTFFHSSEDFSMQPMVATFMRMLRLFGAAISIILPALYIAISYFHQEAMPSQLLLAIAGSREDVPFPAWFEVLVMDLSFELIREAGVRVPGVLGSTIGIVGAIILGQAAVSAHIVSPVVVVIIAITGLASFTIPEYRMASAIRLVRFVLFIFAIYLGLVGMATALLWLTVILCNLKSFGMPYFVPIAPKTDAGLDIVLRGPVYRQEERPNALYPKDKQRQPHISRRWLKKPPAGKGGQE